MYSVEVVPLFVFNIVLFSIGQLLPQMLPIYLESIMSVLLLESTYAISNRRNLNKETIERFARY